MSPALCRWAKEVRCSSLTSLALWRPASDKAQANWKYRRQVSILCPRGYEPRALPLRHTGELLRLTSSLTIVRRWVSTPRPRVILSSRQNSRALPLRHTGVTRRRTLKHRQDQSYYIRDTTVRYVRMKKMSFNFIWNEWNGRYHKKSWRMKRVRA